MRKTKSATTVAFRSLILEIDTLDDITF